jgi:hypothetical protein
MLTTIPLFSNQPRATPDVGLPLDGALAADASGHVQ